ncbi:MAG: GspH/FimT family pseudopilin [Verrucomicrobiae bacterium]|nr:GspH/FimT family pseudopilin [Verrucomicrobiae bacterium]
MNPQRTISLNMGPIPRVREGLRDAARSAAFTLIELIAVIGIMALMMVIAIPSFQSLTKSSAVGIASGQLVNALNLARSQAVTTRSRVRVVFPDNPYTNAMVLPKQSFAILQCTNHDDFSTANWVYLDRWHILPKGAYFSNLNALPAGTGVPFPTNGSPTAANMAILEFNAAGTLTSGSDCSVVVQEGTIQEGTPVAVRAENCMTGLVYAATGRAKVLR